MEKVINGKTYSTETANCVCYGATHGAGGDFSYSVEALYQKRTGEFFIHGKGGPMTKYAKKMEDGNLGFGEMIIPISAEEARAWTEINGDYEDYCKIFGKPEE